ncbi:hypothetical protein OAU50_07985, partial [Planctomycetota bacterium]|nr:hypothetical protein [Planctomycetota bacterium]
ELMEQDGDMDGMAEIRAWRVEEGYDRWKDYKDRLEGDNGMDPKSKSGIEGEDDWKEMSYGKAIALEKGFYKVYANDDWEKRLTEVKWAYQGHREELEIEGQGKATYQYENVYGDSITIQCERKGGLWYMSRAGIEMSKELPKKPKDDE